MSGFFRGPPLLVHVLIVAGVAAVVVPYLADRPLARIQVALLLVGGVVIYALLALVWGTRQILFRPPARTSNQPPDDGRTTFPGDDAMDHAIADRIYADFASCFNAGDLDGLLNLYEPDAVFVRGPGDHVSGHPAIRAALQTFLDTGGKISFKTRHAVQHGDIALLSNEYTLQGTDDEGKPFTMTGKTSEVLRRQPDGRWLYIIDHPAGAED